ncbi:cytidine and deoxycytidylate deaminase zinc-binding region family protein [Lyngbya aestuarii BL J]|uniref:Cytidine and deoxycytidylate deaminase zinc-binding region family protein n=1 Tax=Lyngbya aestuarii BL J TaxID=1348334 RepID=U7QQ86_9CYAN|nr:nucleoside deaminase [Lyngbya aestuarii]ERT09412.1 cytidine and deoxycytidylate deaminase zinc-binding region family protein [Lyngbya aestuarii BL J]
MTAEDYMKIALEEAKKGDMPYGAVLVKENKIVVQGYNTAQRDNDVTAHAEINVLRQFTLENKSYSLDVLKGYTLYTTCEPCPMCAAACVWAGLSEIVFGASTQQLIQLGSPQIDLSCEAVVKKGFQDIKITQGILAEDCLALFK